MKLQQIFGSKRKLRMQRKKNATVAHAVATLAMSLAVLQMDSLVTMELPDLRAIRVTRASKVKMVSLVNPEMKVLLEIEVSKGRGDLKDLRAFKVSQVRSEIKDLLVHLVRPDLVVIKDHKDHRGRKVSQVHWAKKALKDLMDRGDQTGPKVPQDRSESLVKMENPVP